MTSTRHLRTPASLSNEARQALTAAFDAMSDWREGITAANERCLPKLLDQMTAVQHAMGWPDHREFLTRVQRPERERWVHPKELNGHSLAEALEWALRCDRQSHARLVREIIPSFDGAAQLTAYLSRWLGGTGS